VKHQGLPKGVEGSMEKEPKNKENHAQFIKKGKENVPTNKSLGNRHSDLWLTKWFLEKQEK
jgi:hypothetical protein